jgi:hypothetical protein
MQQLIVLRPPAFPPIDPLSYTLPAEGRRMSSTFRYLVCCSLVALCLRPVIAAEALPVEKVEFFEKQVRPLLVQHCQECHGAKKQEAGLRLDNRGGLRKGTDSGPVVVDGNVDGSRLIQVLSHSPNDTQMPPKGKLPDDQIAVLRKWIELGSPWPDDAPGASSSADATKSHWAFQPIKAPAIPAGTVGERSPIDSLAAAALQVKGLHLSPAADRYTFIRRVTLDLWGIPPTINEVQEFEAEAAPDATERLVDRLLASPLYGQRWARHWLDVARYADSKGYVFTAEPRYPYSYTYRDYVVDAFNADKPFDQFVTEQLAADAVVESAANDPRLAALGFLTVGRRYLNNTQDIIDDRIDVVSRGLLGLTVGCARCHDHKFDPVPTDDYYSLYGVFASSMEPEELPIIGTPKEASAFVEFEKELANRERALADYEHEAMGKVMDELRSRAGDCLIVVARENQNWQNVPAVFSEKNEPRKQLVERWKRYLDEKAKPENRVFGPWQQLSKHGVEEFPGQVAQLVERWKSPDGAEDAGKVNALVRQAIITAPPQTLPDLAKVYGGVFNDVQVKWQTLRKESADAKSLPDEAAEELRVILYGEGSPCVVNMDDSRRLVGRDVRDKVTQLKRNVDNLKVTSPGAPPRAMVMRDGQLQNSPVFIRGNPGRHGKQVPRQFLQVVAGPERKPFTKGSGRLELAQAIVDAKNPLTSRVIVNRIWQHHFGTGLVGTPSDFGTRGMPPTNPELLDWLSLKLMDGGWSLKQMQRLILTSDVYRQSSAENEAARAVDPENRLLWRMPRLRVDFEEMRDSMLAVAGRLDQSVGGRPFEDVMNPNNSRRTIYAFVNRNDLPGVFRAFDFADVDASAPERPNTTVPQQALFALNSPFVIEQARRVAAESQIGASDDGVRLSQMYRRVLSREPSSEERELALRFVAEAQTTPTEKQSPWDRLAQTLLLTNEFWFAD